MRSVSSTFRPLVLAAICLRVFTAIHAATGAVVLATIVLCPPRRPFVRA